MKRPAPLLIALAALACCRSAFAQMPAAQPPVVARDLRKLRIAGKVEAVLWTRREDRLTLQIVPPRANRISFPGNPAPKAQPFADRVQVWLLRADGTPIMPAGVSTPMVGSGVNARLVEVLYVFPLSANKEAVAVAMKFDDQLHIEELAPFTN
jgi:hypothetical protein